MLRGSTKLLSVPFIALYVATISAAMLFWGPPAWRSMTWFPIAVGITAAIAIIPLKFLLEQRLLDRSASDWARIVFFFFTAVFPLIAVPFLTRQDWPLICGLAGWSLLSLWAAFGTWFHWPGFRPPPGENECPQCRYDLTDNVSGVCPECGRPIDEPPDELQ